MKKDFKISLYTALDLRKKENMSIFWQFLNQKIITPIKYDGVEKTKLVYTPDAFLDAISLYRVHGMLFVKGKKNNFLATLNQYSSNLAIWDFYFSIEEDKKDIEKWFEWCKKICLTFPIIYGIGGTEEEFAQRHEIVKYFPTGGRVTSWVGALLKELYTFLPGIYWLTISSR